MSTRLVNARGRDYDWPACPSWSRSTSIQLPSVTVLKASAGSGKTRTLTERYVQFLLSPLVPKNGLRNILAITFSNNASREMKENILVWLKSLALRDQDRLREIALITSGGDDQIARKARETVETMLGEYSDFQVRTIDSFMSTIFRASAIELGFPPDFQIVMDPAPLLDYALDLFLRDARSGSPRPRSLTGRWPPLWPREARQTVFPGSLPPRSGRSSWRLKTVFPPSKLIPLWRRRNPPG